MSDAYKKVLGGVALGAMIRLVADKDLLSKFGEVLGHLFTGELGLARSLMGETFKLLCKSVTSSTGTFLLFMALGCLTYVASTCEDFQERELERWEIYCRDMATEFRVEGCSLTQRWANMFGLTVAYACKLVGSTVIAVCREMLKVPLSIVAFFDSVLPKMTDNLRQYFVSIISSGITVTA